MPREGEVREDGKVYWRFRKGRGEVWLTPEKYELYCKKRREYSKMCHDAWHQRQSQLPDSQKTYFGKYNWKTNKYFIGLSTSGKEIWVYKARFEERLESNRRSKKKYLDKLKSLTKTGLKIGDKNPDNPEQYVLSFTGNKPRFGNYAQLLQAKESRKIIDKKMRARRKKIRAQVISKLVFRLKRGHVNPENGMIFWEYTTYGKPRWLNPEDFKRKHDKVILQKKLRRQKNKSISYDIEK